MSQMLASLKATLRIIASESDFEQEKSALGDIIFSISNSESDDALLEEADIAVTANSNHRIIFNRPATNAPWQQAKLSGGGELTQPDFAELNLTQLKVAVERVMKTVLSNNEREPADCINNIARLDIDIADAQRQLTDTQLSTADKNAIQANLFQMQQKHKIANKTIAYYKSKNIDPTWDVHMFYYKYVGKNSQAVTVKFEVHEALYKLEPRYPKQFGQVWVLRGVDLALEEAAAAYSAEQAAQQAEAVEAKRIADAAEQARLAKIDHARAQALAEQKQQEADKAAAKQQEAAMLSTHLPLGSYCQVGEICRQTGIWQVICDSGEQNSHRLIVEGEVMGAYGVTENQRSWRLVSYHTHYADWHRQQMWFMK